MAEESKIYICEVCRAKVRVVKKNVPDSKRSTLTRCGKEMEEKAEEEEVKKI